MCQLPHPAFRGHIYNKRNYYVFGKRRTFYLPASIRIRNVYYFRMSAGIVNRLTLQYRQ